MLLPTSLNGRLHFVVPALVIYRMSSPAAAQIHASPLFWYILWVVKRGRQLFFFLRQPVAAAAFSFQVMFVFSAACVSYRLTFQSNPTLKYLYPPPSHGILTNITHVLMSVPKFYVQVSISCFCHVNWFLVQYRHIFNMPIMVIFVYFYCILYSYFPSLGGSVNLWQKKCLQDPVFKRKHEYPRGLWTPSILLKIKRQTFAF